MRVISQDGNFDLNYENATLEIYDSNSIFAYTDATQPRQMAKYSSREKALKAIEMLHILYEDRECCNAYFYDYPKVFRFPTDEDLEV